MLNSTRNLAESAMKASHKEEIEPPWNRESIFTKRLYHDGGINGKPRFHKYDLWHAFHLGVAKHWCGSSLWLLSKAIPASTIDLRFAVLSEAYLTFCRNKKIPTIISKIDQHTVSGNGGEGGWNKAAVSSNICLFLEDFCEKNPDIIRGKKLLEHVDP